MVQACGADIYTSKRKLWALSLSERHAQPCAAKITREYRSSVLCNGSSWPITLMRTEAVSGVKLPCQQHQGHSKNPTGHGRYCLGAVFAEVFSSDGYRAAETANDADGSIAKRGEVCPAWALDWRWKSFTGRVGSNREPEATARRQPVVRRFVWRREAVWGRSPRRTAAPNASELLSRPVQPGKRAFERDAQDPTEAEAVRGAAAAEHPVSLPGEIWVGPHHAR